MKFRAFVTIILTAYLLAPALAQPGSSFQPGNNAPRIGDWETLLMLTGSKLEKAEVDADSPEELIAQLNQIIEGLGGDKSIEFSFPTEIWEVKMSDGIVSKAKARVSISLVNVDLLTFIYYVSELNLMTFDVMKNKIIFRPKMSCG